MSNISYIRILQAIESFASAHLQIKKFASDFPTQMPNFATEDEAYPILFVSPNTSIFDENTNTFQLEVYCFDIIQKDRNNINTILSDTNQILNDLDKWLKEGDIAGIDVMTSTTATPINNALLDYAAGWQMTIVLTTDTYGICEIPFSEVPVITTEVNNIIYQSFLTCETLAACETFESAINNLQGQINNLTGGTEFDCAALSGCTVIQDINSELSGLTSDINALSATTEFIQDNYVPYTGATRDLDLGYNTFINNNGLLTTWNNESSLGEAKFGYDYYGAKQMYFVDTDKTNNFQYSGQTIDFICNIEEGWGTSNYGRDFNDGTLFISTISNNIGGALFNTQMGTNNISQVITTAGEVALTNLTNNAGPLMSSSIRLWKDYTKLLITNDDTTEANTIEMYTDRTYTKKYITTDEGFVGDYVQFNTAATETSAVGKLKWNDTDGTLDLGLKGGNVTLQLGQEQVARVVNKTSPLIDLLEANYQVVKIVGATGQRLSVALAQADSDLDSATTLGVVTETINRNQEGFVTTGGQVKEINTTGSLQGETWNDGDVLYLSPTTAGRLTKVKPVAPQHMVIVGYVEYAHSQHGKIFVKVDNGYELDELHNVKISAATSGDVLTYNSSTQVWENKSLNEITGEFNYILTTPVSFSGTAAETEVLRLEIPAYTFAANDMLKIPTLLVQKVGTVNSYTIRVKISTSSTMPATTTDMVAVYNGANTVTQVNMSRTWFLSGGVLRGLGNSSSVTDGIGSTVQLNVAFDRTITNYLYISIDSAGGQDTQTLVGFQLTNR